MAQGGKKILSRPGHRYRIKERNFRTTTDIWMCMKQIKPNWEESLRSCEAFNNIKYLRCGECGSLRGRDDVAYKRNQRGGTDEVGIFRHEFYILYWLDPDSEDRQAEATKGKS